MSPTEKGLRWRLADDDSGQAALFDEGFERHVGRGEYRGMEFLHVHARSIINEVPKASKVPFRYTINAYRGCSHACSYCMAGETPILMANGRTKALADVRAGDQIYGTVRVGSYRTYVTTEVLDHWSTVKPAYRVTLEDGTQLVTSGDHRFLSDRGWKFVTGSENGRLRRPHLTLNNKLMGTGRFATSPVHGPEYRRGYLCGMIRGDGHLGSYTHVRPLCTQYEVHRFRLALVDLEALQRSRGYLADLDIATDEFQFHEAVGQQKALRAIRTSTRAKVAAITEIVAWPSVPSIEWQKGFLAGIFDAEGSYSGSLRIANTDPEIIAHVVSCLRSLGFRYRVELTKNPNGRKYIWLLGGVRQALRLFHTADPAITRKRIIEGQAIKNDAPLRVVSIEPLGLELPLFDITTGTGDFIADGVVSHNCFARPTHEYLGLDSAQDFEKRIVVKVNAVERLRAELSPGRWAGDHIAMGTNTDPYQRCEGKYRLTRGIVETLAEARNPFSILTKSTLILRDLDVLTEATKRTDVRANFSIGTLDEEVWRTSEPGTPHPRRRVEALAKLNEAGVTTGVLIAPVLPGLSDTPEQLEAIVKACVEAGAASISPILLHLRPGVREHYLAWLADTYPDQVPLHEELYPRAYAPSGTQQALSRLVGRLVARHRGFSTAPRQVRDVEPREQAPPARRHRADRQLSLEM